MIKSSNFKWIVILIIVLAVLWFVKSCNQTGGSKIVETVRIDTFYKEVKDTVRIPYQTLVPYRVEYIKDRILHDTLTNLEFIQSEADTAQILQQYFATRYYSLTSDVQYGKATINDTVTQNRITGRSIILDQKIPEVIKTVTLEKKRAILFFGISALGNQKELPFASGVTLDLKTRSDFMVGVGGYFTNDERGMVGVSLKFPVRLRKK